ncbi:UbiA prenyltransferase family protein [Sorangium sp. So ce131]|uniref:UbiA prenyltransferase family protein n=1 Tax=Sorangium sp. So ce131 TaxID=3133282 RepID=UPI003F645FDD
METSATPAQDGPFARAWNAFLAYQRFVRLSVFGLTAMMPLLGAGSVSARLTEGRTWGLVAVALAFHHYIYVHNDVVDLAVDRGHPRRAKYPLVKGSIQPRHALWFALGQLPIAFLLTLVMEGSWAAHLALAVAIVAGAMYNLWGKTNPFPPLTDAIQGVAWAALVFYGAAMAEAAPTLLTWVLAAHIVVFIILVNGIHGSLRDLVSDCAAGMKTTAVLLGARPDEEGGLHLPRRLAAYTFGLQALCTGLLFWPLAVNELAYDDATRWSTSAAVALLQVAAIAADVIMLRTTNPSRMFGPVMFHIIASLLSVMALFMPYVAPPLGRAVVLTFFVPILIYDTYYGPVLRRLRRRGAQNG